ncbi:MAG TPA: GtrA family protein [Williamwhitmania sp.]|jgi:putative flippase GtrA|nr:GtrA family protein [Williamwhitmania sp.]
MEQLGLNADVVAKFLKFGLVGISGLFIDFGITFLLRNKLKIHQYIANATGFITAASTNYILNRVYTFHSHNPHMLMEYGKFIGVSIVGLGINTFVLWLLVSKANWNFYFAKLFAIGAATMWNFIINLAITFV